MKRAEEERRGRETGSEGRKHTLCVYCSSTPGENSMTQSDGRATVLASLNWDAGDIKNPRGVVHVSAGREGEKIEGNIVDTTRPQSRGSLLIFTVILGNGSLKAPWISWGPASPFHRVNTSTGSRDGRREPAAGHLVQKPNTDQLKHWFLPKRGVVSQQKQNKVASFILLLREIRYVL